MASASMRRYRRTCHSSRVSIANAVISRGHEAPFGKIHTTRVRRDGDAVPVSAAQHVEDTNGANRTLIAAIAKGHHWQAQLESGEYAGLEDLAKDVGCDRPCVGRMGRLTSLAPDIIETIPRGDEPDGLSQEKPRKHLPVRWEEQRKAMGR